MAANIPAALWHAYTMLGERRYAGVAEVTTSFIIDHLFEGETLVPVGNRGGWSRNTSKALFDQLPCEVCSVVEMLCIAEHSSGNYVYRGYANNASRWFTGENIQDELMIDDQEYGCYDALTVTGPDHNQGAAATISYLLTLAALSVGSQITNASVNCVAPVG
jgi:hypothetical protein